MSDITTINQEQEQKYYKLDFAQLAKLIYNDLEKTKASTVFNNINKEQVSQALQNPQKNEQMLRNLSNFLYIASPQYKRLCSYYAEMLSFDHYIEPYKLDISKVNAKQFLKQYNETLFEVDNMNIKHEFQKVLQIAFREGVFYGYEYKTDDSYFLQKLNPDYCQITGVEDGVYNFKFDFSYFTADESRLNNYASEFTTKYNTYKNSKKARGKNKENLQWQEIDSAYSICIKPDETILYPFPPFVGVLQDIFEINDYKSLKKANNEMQNYALISGKIPMKDNSDTANDFKIGLDTAIQFGNKIVEELPDQVGFLLSVFDDMQLFRLSDDKVGTDRVEEAVKNFWSSTGVSKNLFADDSSTDAAIKYSTITDEQSVFAILRQIERWINRKLKFNEKKYKFKINLLDITHTNRKDMVTELLKACQFGLPYKSKLFVSMGASQSSMSSMEFLENDILGLHENWIPLQSSFINPGSADSPTNGESKRPSSEETDNQIDLKDGDE